MKLNFNKQKNTYLLLLFYGVVLSFVYLNIRDFGIHIEEKFHRLNGHYWLNYIATVFHFENLIEITKIKINEISDYSLSNVSYYNKYGIIFDLPMSFFEILFKIDDVNKIYYFKHLFSFLIFLLSSLVFYRILQDRYENFFLSFIGISLYVCSPRIFGDSFFYKDVLFLSFLTFTIYFFLKCIRNMSFNNVFLLSLFTAFSVNLRFFSIIIPFILFFVIIIKSFYLKNFKYMLKRFSSYFLLFFIILFITWPYLWSNPIINFFEIFSSLNKDLIDVKILFNENYFSNRALPDTYLVSWIIISSPIFQNFLFFFGFILYSLRICNRFFKIQSYSVYNDLWRGKREETDFVLFIFITIFYLLFLVFNAPLYNGWRLVYFLNIFFIYFAIYFLNYLKIKLRKKKTYENLFFIILIFSISLNYYSIVKYHPFQSLYFNNFFSERKINGFEGDYHGIGAKDFFERIIEIDDDKIINVAVASHTPLHRGLEALDVKIRDKFNVVGQEYHLAKYIYKNNISEVNSYINKKYEVPANFSKIYEKKIGKLIIYEVFQKD